MDIEATIWQRSHLHVTVNYTVRALFDMGQLRDPKAAHSHLMCFRFHSTQSFHYAVTPHNEVSWFALGLFFSGFSAAAAVLFLRFWRYAAGDEVRLTQSTADSRVFLATARIFTCILHGLLCTVNNVLTRSIFVHRDKPVVITVKLSLLKNKQNYDSTDSFQELNCTDGLFHTLRVKRLSFRSCFLKAFTVWLFYLFKVLTVCFLFSCILFECL